MNLPPAPLGRRFLAQLVDLGVVGALSYGVVFLGLLLVVGVMSLTGAAGGMEDLRKGDLAALLASPAALGLILCVVALVLAVLTLFHGYFVFHEYRSGATPGKRIFGLKVASLDDRPLTLGRCVVREVLRDLDLLLLLPSLACVLLTGRRQRFGDLAARTYVAHSPREERALESMYLDSELYERLSAACPVAAVPEEERQRFLEFAYPCFVLRSRASSSAELERWVPFLDARVPGWRGHFADAPAALLYLAEACFRQANERV